MSQQEEQHPEEEDHHGGGGGGGIVLELSPDVAEDLRRQQRQRQEQRIKKGKDKTTRRLRTKKNADDYWNDTLQLPLEEKQQDTEFLGDDVHGNASSSLHVGVDDDNDNNDNNNDDSSDCLSFSSPPHSMPQIMVNLEQLVGYTPATPEEAAILYKQVKAAIWGTAYHHYDADDNVDGHKDKDKHDQSHEQKEQQDDEEEDIQEACKLDERVSKLFQTGVARHVDTNMKAATNTTTESGSAPVDSLRYCRIDYPEYLYQVSSGSGDESSSSSPSPRVVKTAHLWKQLLQRTNNNISIPVVDRVLEHLQNCSQSLFWKQAMHVEIKHLALVQQEEFTRHQQAMALQAWESAGRKVKLEELYAVRETFVHRLELAKTRLQRLQDEREVAIKRALEQRRLQQRAGGLEALDFNSNVFAFHDDDDDDDNFGGLFDDGYDLLGNRIKDDDDADDDGVNDGYNLVSEEEEEEEHDLDDYSSSSSYAENDSSCLDDRLDIQEATENEKTIVSDNAEVANFGNDARILPSEKNQVAQSSGHDDKPNRHADATRKQRLRLEQATKDAEYRAKLEAAKDLERRLREELTNHELKTAMVAAEALEKRLERVDDLLETLQEEEWANEEKNEDSEQRMESLTIKNDDTPREVTLLDQILAMILGSSPPELGQDMESHIRYIEKEHLEIVREWRTQFGRLPSAFVRTKPRAAVGSGITKSGENTTGRSPEVKEGETTAKKDATFQKTKDRKSLKQELGILDNNESDWENGSL